MESQKRRTHKTFRISACFFLLFVSLFDAAYANDPVSNQTWFDSLGCDIVHKLPQQVIDDSKTTFLRNDNLLILMAAGGASIAMNNTDADKNLDENFQRHTAFGSEFADRALDFVGGPGPQFAAAGLWYAISYEKGDEFNKDRAWTMIRALSVTGLTTAGLKAARGNYTPNGKKWAWPSGHTSSSFTVASVLHEFYGPEVGLMAYTGASVVAWRMMDTGDHWASDVVFGAALGWTVGHTIAGEHKKLELSGFEIIPTVVTQRGPAAGISLFKTF